MAEPADAKLSRNTRPSAGFTVMGGHAWRKRGGKWPQQKVTPHGVVTGTLLDCSLHLPFAGFGYTLDKWHTCNFGDTHIPSLAAGGVGIYLSSH